ncbi:hypothetical protein [Prescottella equi]|uniref:Uncharacterized protein n=1 Tax=Prescottella equi ATCC 33707 TaxID=525370 RepID=E9T059_RHOHA|nr:hypothetical protein [Prescottella equi]EGD24642.1 hypothetical protein HMPREF0724_11760 [Prescottella equi ATCC 33707]
MAELRILPKPLVRRPNTIDNLEYLREFGQTMESTRENVALLNGVRGFAAAYMTKNVNIEWSFGSNVRKLPFDAPFGVEPKGARVDPSGHIVFDEAGLWSCTAITRARKTDYSGNDGVVLYLSVRRPDGSIYDELQDDKQLGNKSGSLILTAPFLVPEPGYQLHALVWSGKWRWFDGGTRFSRLFAVKHDNRPTNPGQETVPDESN